MGPVKASKACNSQCDLAKLLVKKATIAIMPHDQKLTKDLTKWDSAHTFGMASTAQYMIRCHNDAMKAHYEITTEECANDRENDYESI